MLLSGAIFQAQNTPKYVCGRGFAPDPLEKITELPYPLAGFQGATSQQRRGGKGRGREGRRKREGGSVPPLLFLQFNNCSAVIVAATYTRSLDLALQLVTVDQSVAIMQIDCAFFDNS